MSEIWDAYDSDFNRIENMTLIRGQAIPDGFFHLVCDVIVMHHDESYLLMQRDSRKHFGGMWEATAGGSALQGENPLDCAIRELREETGIIAEQLTEIGRVVNHETHTIYVEFLCKTNWDKKSIILQEGETSDYKWISRDALRKMVQQELVTKRMQTFIEAL